MVSIWNASIKRPWNALSKPNFHAVTIIKIIIQFFRIIGPIDIMYMCNVHRDHYAFQILFSTYFSETWSAFIRLFWESIHKWLTVTEIQTANDPHCDFYLGKKYFIECRKFLYPVLLSVVSFVAFTWQLPHTCTCTCRKLPANPQFYHSLVLRIVIRAYVIWPCFLWFATNRRF